MTGRTHDLAAISVLGIVALTRPLPTMTLSTVLVALLANLIGGITPDIDEPTAPFWRNLPIGGWVGRVIARLLGGHRFITHSLLGLALFGGLARLLLNFLAPIMPHVDRGLVWWAFMIGMVSHLAMDTLTKEGVPWLLPVPIKFGLPPLRALRITTGKGVENWVVFPGIIVADLLLAWAHYGRLIELIHHKIG